MKNSQNLVHLPPYISAYSRSFEARLPFEEGGIVATRKGGEVDKRKLLSTAIQRTHRSLVG